MDTHENVDEHVGIGVGVGRNWEVEQRKTKNAIGHNRNAAFPRWLSIYL